MFYHMEINNQEKRANIHESKLKDNKCKNVIPVCF